MGNPPQGHTTRPFGHVVLLTLAAGPLAYVAAILAMIVIPHDGVLAFVLLGIVVTVTVGVFLLWWQYVSDQHQRAHRHHGPQSRP